MKGAISRRISFLFFFQFVIAGAFSPILALYLKDYLHFTGSQIGLIMAGSAIAAFIGPLLNTVVAERWVSTERLYGLCQISGGIFMLLLSFQTRFFPFFFIYLLYFAQFGPTNSLLNAVAFHHAPKNKGQFSGMRVWGTVGWITIAFLFSFLWLRRGGDLHGAFFFAAGGSLFVGIYTLIMIPGAEKRATGRKKFFPREVLAVLFNKDILLLCIGVLSFTFAERIYYFCLGIYIRGIGVSEAAVLPLGSIAQMVEIPAMLLFPLIYKKLGSKRTLLLGAFLVFLKYFFMTWDTSLAALVAGLVCHGPAFTFFMITAFIYLDEHCDSVSRTGAHQLFMLLETGAASLLGNLTAGFLLDRATLPGGGVNFRLFWSVPCLIGLFLFLFLLFFFPGDSHKSRS